MPLVRVVLAALLVAAAPVSAALAQAPPLAERLEAARAAARVQSALAADEELARFVLTASLRDGVVVLTGTVATAAQRARAEAIARGTPGVVRIDNRLEVDARAARRTGPIPPPVRPTQPELRPADPPAPAPSPAPAAEAAAVYHTVRPGDTLAAIARQHGVSVQQIQRLNGLRGTTIRPGQRLRVR